MFLFYWCLRDICSSIYEDDVSLNTTKLYFISYNDKFRPWLRLSDVHRQFYKHTEVEGTNSSSK